MVEGIVIANRLEGAAAAACARTLLDAVSRRPNARVRRGLALPRTRARVAERQTQAA